MKIQTKLLGSMALSILLITGMTGCGSDDTNTDTTQSAATISPYQRIAVIPNADWGDVNSIAEKISSYVHDTDENATLGLPTNWVIGGANVGAGDVYDGLADLLPIPAIGGKSRVIEFCNGAYATMATNTGRFHGSALPCEVSVHSDGTNVYIDMLDADAIFSLFFTDISDPDGNLEKVAAAVKSEIRLMVLSALEKDTATASSTLGLTGPITHEVSTLQMGPTFTQSEIDNDVAFKTPYLVYKYTGTGTGAGGTFTKTDAKTLSKEIIAKLGTDAATADKTSGLEGLSSGSAWRSGRPDPLAIPGVFVAEACSPKYATKATALGNEYITALPCEITTYVDETDDTNQTLSISFLNPNFMFGTMFKGAVSNAYKNGDLNQTQVVEYSTLADVVFADLRLIADAAVEGSALSLTVK